MCGHAPSCVPSRGRERGSKPFSSGRQRRREGSTPVSSSAPQAPTPPHWGSGFRQRNLGTQSSAHSIPVTYFGNVRPLLGCKLLEWTLPHAWKEQFPKEYSPSGPRGRGSVLWISLTGPEAEGGRPAGTGSRPAESPAHPPDPRGECFGLPSLCVSPVLAGAVANEARTACPPPSLMAWAEGYTEAVTAQWEVGCPGG